MNLEAHITSIGHELVACQHHCEGIILDPASGILPRFLVLESQGRADNQGAVIIGINPGRTSGRERNFYLDHNLSYENTVEYWENEGIKTRRYYTWLRSFVDQLGFGGPLLWTELAKCESAPGVQHLPFQTLRTCMGSFLQKELEAIPDTWPLVCAGSESYKAIAFRFLERTIIGIPHPTGAFGHFFRLFDENRLVEDVKARVAGARSGTTRKAIWLSLDLETVGRE